MHMLTHTAARLTNQEKVIVFRQVEELLFGKEGVKVVLKSVFTWTSVKGSRDKIKRSVKTGGG